MRVLTALTLLALGLTAMAWAAAPPPGATGSGLLAPARATLGNLRGWLRDDRPAWHGAQRTVAGGSAARGARRIVENGCGARHLIPRIAGAHGKVGPPLTGLADRAYLAGVLPNTPGGMIRWLVNPPAHSPETAMPDLDLTENEARDIAAFLMTLKGNR